MRTIEFDGKQFPFTWYRGEVLRGTVERPVAYDSETRPIPPYRQPLPGEDPLTITPSPLVVPEIAVGMAYDGDQLFLIHPSRLKEYIRNNRTVPTVGHNYSFDFWVLMKWARDHKDAMMEEWLWQMGDNNRISDSAVLDLLLQLGTGRYRMGKNKGKASGGADKKLLMASLAVVCAEFGCGELDKTDPYRLRFDEWCGKTEEEIEAHPEFEGFAAYALKDVIATHRVFPLQYKKAVEIMRKAGWSENPSQKTYEIRPDALRLFGPLSLYLQCKGAIVLDELSRTPVYIDQDKQAEAEAATRERYQKCMDALMELEPELFKRYAPKAKKGMAGQIRYNKASGLPEMDYTVLKRRLETEAAMLGVDVPISEGKQKGISTSVEDWEAWTDRSVFLASWCGLKAEGKLLSFFLSLKSGDGKAYSRYNLLMRTGRTSAQGHKDKKKLLCTSFNIQQMPRPNPKHPERSVRELFEPPPGHKWYSNDFGYIELCALAAVCRARFGWSKLGDAIEVHRRQGGIDPHQLMAATILNMQPDEFLRLEKTIQKEYRRKAKASGFGYPGGLGIKTFLVYAATQYGASFTKQEAKETKEKWLRLYPEMKLYLSDPTELAMRWQTDRRTAPKLSYMRRKRLSDYLKMSDKERSEAKYSEEELDRMWGLLSWIAQFKEDPELTQACFERKVTSSVRNLTTYRACSLTGRVRNLVNFTSGCNSPFQGSASDGCKLALWNLMRRGIHLLGFVHDSIECALPIGKEKSLKPIIDKVMVQSMEFVLGQNVPVGVDGAIGPCWSKA